MKKRLPAFYCSLLPLFSLLASHTCPAQAEFASVSLAGFWAAQGNPSGLGWTRHLSAGVFYSDPFLMKQLTTKTGAAAFPLKKGTFGLSFENYGCAVFRRNKTRLSFGRSFSKKIAFGISLNHLSLNLTEYGRKDLFVAEAGIQSKPLKSLTIGAHLFNPTRSRLTAYPDEKIPTIMRLGFDYRFSEKVFVCVETEKDITSRAIIKAGLEYHPRKELYLRAGAASNPSLSSFGIGLRLDDLLLEINSSYHSVLGFSPRISLTYEFRNALNK